MEFDKCDICGNNLEVKKCPCCLKYLCSNCADWKPYFSASDIDMFCKKCREEMKEVESLANEVDINWVY